MTSRSRGRAAEAPPSPPSSEEKAIPDVVEGPVDMEEALARLDAEATSVEMMDEPLPMPVPAAPPVKRGRGRPRGSTNKGTGARATKAQLADQVADLERKLSVYVSAPTTAEQEQQCRFAAAATARMLFAGAAQAFGPWWALDENEVGLMADAWGPILVMHHEDVGRYVPYLAALGVTAQMVLPRWKMSQARPAESESAPDRSEDATE